MIFEIINHNLKNEVNHETIIKGISNLLKTQNFFNEKKCDRLAKILFAKHLKKEKHHD